jgi:hypothetical protein
MQLIAETLGFFSHGVLSAIGVARQTHHQLIRRPFCDPSGNLGKPGIVLIGANRN